jgi:hypothetical protein
MHDKSTVSVLTLAFLLFTGGMFSAAHAEIPAIERAALIALYNSTDGDNWTDNSGWKDGVLAEDGFAMSGTEGTWHGISLNTAGTTVEGISLGQNNLDGTIPASLGNLANLKQLYLFSNELTGNIPAELGSLTNLGQLYLNSNQIDGGIPPELGNLASLLDLSLYLNDLEGSIPPELGDLTNLLYLRLNHNQLTGSIPSELGNLASLRSLSLYNNELTGSIPSELGNLASMERLYLENNELTGSIPSQLGNLTSLQFLSLYNNQLTGSVPADLGSLGSLEGLSLQGNKLSGPIPTSLSNLTSLTSANIGYNALYTNEVLLQTFLNGKDPDWADTQTVAPEDVSLSYLSDTSLRVSWTPISYTAGSGGYRVMYSETSGGPYTLFDQTINKSISHLDVTGLDPNTAYYFVVQTQTDPVTQNQNTVLSEYSEVTVGATRIVKGDVYWDGKIDLNDAISALQILIGVHPPTTINNTADVNGDGKIGLPEALFALRVSLDLFVYVAEETKETLQEVTDCMAMAMDESTKEAESVEKMTGLTALIGLADAQEAAGGGVAAFINYLLNDLEFPCGDVARQAPLSTTIVFTFTGEPVCNNVTGTMKVTPELSEGTLSYSVEYINVQTEGCLIDGNATTTMSIEGTQVTATHTFDQMSMCGDEFDGTVTVVYDIVTGEVISVSTEQNAYTVEGCDATMDLVISYNSEDGINGTATIEMDGETYEIEMNNIKIDQTCGLPTSGSMTMDGIVLDFSTTSCNNPVVTVTMEGQTFNLNLETGEIT